MYLRRIANQEEALEQVLHYKRTKLQRIVENFMMTEDVIAEIEVDLDEYKNLRTAQSALGNRISNMGLKKVLVTSIKDGHLYIINVRKAGAMEEKESKHGND